MIGACNRHRILQQLNDSNFIVSILRSYMTDASHSFDELVTFYPHHLTDPAGDGKRMAIECRNKYFTMYPDETSKLAIEDKK